MGSDFLTKDDKWENIAKEEKNIIMDLEKVVGSLWCDGRCMEWGGKLLRVKAICRYVNLSVKAKEMVKDYGMWDKAM